MKSAKSIGRIVGVLLLAQIAVALLAQFVLLAGVFEPPGFLANAAGSALQVRLAVLLWFVAGATTLCAAIVALPLFRALSDRMALLYLALGVVSLCTLAADNVGVLTMLSLSQDYAKTGAASEQIQTLYAMARSARSAAHFTNILFGGTTAFVLELIFFRFALVPRLLVGVALATVPLQTGAVTMALLGYGFQTWMLVPAALTHFALILWLMARGFTERRVGPA